MWGVLFLLAMLAGMAVHVVSTFTKEGYVQQPMDIAIFLICAIIVLACFALEDRR